MYEAENTFTVEFWVKPSGTHEIDGESTNGTAGASGQKYVMYPTNGGDGYGSRAGMGVSVGTNGVSVYEHAAGYMPPLLAWQGAMTEWTHVAVVYNNGRPSLYINGVWVKDGLQSPKQHVHPGTQFPGGFYGSQANGQLDEVRIWSVARTQQQIAANMTGELPPTNTGLQGYWPMNEGMGAVLHDVSGSGRNIDLTSAGYSGANWTNGRYSITTTTASSYRYGFNGQEHSTEIGEDDYTAQFWEYDSRIGRRWNVDPVVKSAISGYSVLGNNPILFADPDGDDWYKDKKTGGYDWKDGSGRHKGFKHMKTGTWSERNKNGISYYFGNAKDGLVMDGGTMNVTVTAKFKRPFNSPMFGNDKTPLHEIREASRQRAMYYAGRQGGADIGQIPGINPDYVKSFERGWQAEQDYRAMQGIVVGLLALPVALEAGLVSSTEYFLWKAGLDGAGQLVANGGDWRQIDVWDMTLSGISTPGASALFGGGVDIRLNGDVSLVGYNKSWQTATIDGAFKYAFGSKGVNSVPKNMIQKLTFSTPLTNLEKLVVERALSVPINMSGKAIRKTVKQQTGF